MGRSCPLANMTGGTLIIFRCNMTRLAACFAHVPTVNFIAGRRSVYLMTVCAGRLSFNRRLAGCLRAIAMQFFCVVAIDALHPIFKMNIPDSAIAPCKLRKNTSTMTGGTGFFLISFLKSVISKQSLLHAGDRRCSDMTISTAGMAGSTGLFENFCIELIGLCLGKTLVYTISLTSRRVVQCFFVMLANRFMTRRACINIL